MRRLIKTGWTRYFFSLSVLCAAAGARPGWAAEFQLTPALTLSEEFNDNIHQSVTDKQSDFVTRIRPGATLLYRTPVLTTDLAYNFDYRHYARGSSDNEQIHTLALHGSAALYENFLFTEVSDTLRRVSLDVARDVTTESLSVNQTDQNVAIVSSYLRWRPGGKSVLKTGYRYTDTRYFGGSGTVSGIDEQEHRGFAELTYDPMARLSLTAGYAFSSVDTDLLGYHQHDLSVGGKYEFAENSTIFCGIGNSWQAFSDSRRVSNLFWHAGVTKDFGSLVATAETRVQYAEDPLSVSTKETSYRASLEKSLQYGSVGLSSSYSEYAALEDGVPDRRRTAIDGFGRYEISPRFTATVAATGDKVSARTADDYPYHGSVSAAVSCVFNYEITAAFSYTYIEYRRELDSSADARQNNRVVLEARKVF